MIMFHRFIGKCWGYKLKNGGQLFYRLSRHHLEKKSRERKILAMDAELQVLNLVIYFVENINSLKHPPTHSDTHKQSDLRQCEDLRVLANGLASHQRYVITKKGRL